MIDPSKLPATSSSPGQPPMSGEPGASGSPLPERVGRYRLCRRLGAGGFGEVYLAHDEELDRPVAVKLPHAHCIAPSGEVDVYLAEARAVARLDHPNIVPVYDFGRMEDGRCYIVSKYIEGTNLAARIALGRPSCREAAAMAAIVADALHHAHLQGIVHRDVKPSNVLLDAAGKPFLADFGVALRDEDFGTGPGNVGTVFYMSPEQARGEGHRVDGRSDVFSLCVVLYEMLTGRRPFFGKTARDFFAQIAAGEPRPPRQLDDTIPKELERICLKGLSKRIADRYTTAKDLADDLRMFLAESPAPLGSPAPQAAPAPSSSPETPPSASTVSELGPGVRIVPKGLRAYDAEDAEFFLHLLPGPRDRQGLPESVSFWKRRIETDDPEEAFPIGVMYGPSGCGKTSLVRAGLLPRLAGHVLPVYLEVDRAATEARLLRRLRFACPGLPAGLGLREGLAAIRRNPAFSGGKKVLLVLDQFEQWLHAPSSGKETGLVQALRQCDGSRVQCLILVRDDFWLAVSRFLRDLEVPLLESRNSALVDLFDASHARKVLAALGRAFGALPAGELDRSARAFLQAAVAGLAQDGRVVCVRLALFAEMMKGRPWTPAALRSVGGVTGIGVRFLEETFASPAAPPEHRLHQRAARAVLEALLPEDETEIRGRMRSYHELLAVSGYARRPADFHDVLRVLDRELRLVTPGDPEGRPEDAAPAEGRPGREPSYQLTHDYLVPSLREWLREKRRQTIRGRTELRLAERARRWNANPEPRQLPSAWEWLRILAFTRPGGRSESQQRMMRAARRHYLRRGAVLALAIVALVVALREISGRYHAATVVDRLLVAETADAPAVIAEIRPYDRWARPRLIRALDDPDPRKQLHASLALLPGDPGQAEFLCARLLDAGPGELRILCEAMTPRSEEMIEPMWQLVADPGADARGRFRAACALAAWDPASHRWKQHGEQVAGWLVSENGLLLGRWLDDLRPVAAALVRPLTDLYLHSENSEVRQKAAIVLAEYLREDLGQLLSLNRAARGAELAVLAAALRGHRPQVLRALKAELTAPYPDRASEAEKDTLARQRANAAVALCLLGSAETVWPHLAQTEDPRLRTHLVHLVPQAGVDPAALAGRLSIEADPSVRRTILWTLGGYEIHVLGGAQCDALSVRLEETCRDDPDPGIHSAAEWLLRKWGRGDRAVAVARGLRPDRGWYATSQGHTMAVVRGPAAFRMGSPPSDPDRRKEELLHDERIDRSFALSTKEVTLRQYRRFKPAHLLEFQPEALESPVSRVALLDAMAYCRWLSAQEGISEEEMVYEAGKDGTLQVRPDGFAKTGYRLPTEAEWEYACRAGTGTRRHFGHGDEYLASYAWFVVNSGGRMHPVGSLLPNDWGFFDMLGNAAEWCQNRYTAEPNAPGDLQPSNQMHTVRGENAGSLPRSVRSAFRLGTHRMTSDAFLGFRVARTLPFSSSSETRGYP